MRMKLKFFIKRLNRFCLASAHGAFLWSFACTWIFDLASAFFPAAAGSYFQKNIKSNKPSAHIPHNTRKQTDIVRNEQVDIVQHCTVNETGFLS